MSRMPAELVSKLLAHPPSRICRCGRSFAGTGAMCWDCEQTEIARESLASQRRRALVRIAPHLALVTVDGYRCPPGSAVARDLVRAWRPPHGLYLVGPEHSGKTHLAMARSLELIARGIDVMAVRWATVASLALSSGKRAREQFESLRRRTIDADVCLIDGLGSPMPYAAIRELWVLLQARQRRPAGPGLLITSRLTLGELAAEVRGQDGQRIAALLERVCQRVRLDATDARISAAAASARRGE